MRVRPLPKGLHTSGSALEVLDGAAGDVAPKAVAPYSEGFKNINAYSGTAPINDRRAKSGWLGAALLLSSDNR